MRAHVSLLGLLAYSAAFAGNQAGSLSEAKRLSESLGKPILIGFFVPACWECKQFVCASQSDKDVMQALDQVIFLKVNANSEEGVSLRRRFGVRGVPTFLIIDGRENKLKSWTGFRKEEFLTYFSITRQSASPPLISRR